MADKIWKSPGGLPGPGPEDDFTLHHLDPETLKNRPKPEAAVIIEGDVEADKGGVELAWDGEREVEVVFWTGKPGILKLTGDPHILARALMELGVQIARHGQEIAASMAARARGDAMLAREPEEGSKDGTFH